MNRKKYPVTNIGTSLILTVFIILALVTFAVLSMINTNHDYEFTEKIADRTSRYYEASNDASALLAQIDETARQCYTSNQTEYYLAVQKKLGQMKGVTTESTGENCLVSYSVPIGDSQALDVETEILYPSNQGDPFYAVHKWQEVSTREWDGDAKLNLLN